MRVNYDSTGRVAAVTHEFEDGRTLYAWPSSELRTIVEQDQVLAVAKAIEACAKSLPKGVSVIVTAAG